MYRQCRMYTNLLKTLENREAISKREKELSTIKKSIQLNQQALIYYVSLNFKGCTETLMSLGEKGKEKVWAFCSRYELFGLKCNKKNTKA